MNKKVKGATTSEYKGVKFKSKLEVRAYQLLEESGLSFKYEPTKYTLWKGEKLRAVTALAPKKLGPGRYGKELVPQTDKLRDITLTPDFEIDVGYHRIILEVKGSENDLYPYKKKMLLQLLEGMMVNSIMGEFPYYSYIFIEVHSVKQIRDAIEYIKKL